MTLEEISAAPEMKAAASCVSHQTPTVQLKDREDIEDHIFNILSEYGSVSLENGKPLVDSDGNTVYNGIVEQGSRLDIVIGLPASGKSSAIADIISKEHHSMLIDNDEAKRRFPEFNQGWGANAVHAESQIVEQRVFHDAIWQGKNVVLPKVGGDAEGLLDDYIRPAKDAGYQVNVHFVDLDRNKALGRMLNRFIDTGRFLAPELINKYVNGRDGNRIEKTFVKLSESVYADGVSKWSNDVKKGEKPVLKAVRGLTDQFITDLYKTQLSNEQAAETICRFFQEADAGIAASKEDIYGMLEEQIDAHLYGNSLEEPEIRNDRDYVLTLRSRMNSNLRDMEEVLTDIYKVMRMRDLSHTDLSEDMQKALLDFEVCAVYQKRDLIRTDDFLRAEDRTLQENDKTDKGGQLHGEYGTDEVSGAGAGNTGRLCFGGDSGENGRSGEKGEQGNEGTQRRVRKPVEGGGRQAPEGDPAQVHGRSDNEWFATGGVKIDIIPITPEKTGTLAEYLPRVEQYLEDKAKEMALSEKNVQEKEQKREVCMPAGSLYSAFKIRRRVEDERYHLIADVKLPDGEIRKAQVIGEFEDHAAISGFCKKNGIVYDDITNDLKNRIEKKRRKSGGRDIQQPDPGHKKNRGAEMDDDK